MRRQILTFTAVAAVAVLAQPAEAQLKFGLQGAIMTGREDLSGVSTSAPDLNGTFGVGPRVALQPPLFPIGVVGQGVYYFPDCGTGDCGYLTYGLAAQLRLPLPIINPYAIGGWQWRRSDENGAISTENGPMVGVGVQLNLALALFLEVTAEFNDDVTGAQSFDNDPIVIKGGVMLGN